MFREASGRPTRSASDDFSCRLPPAAFLKSEWSLPGRRRECGRRRRPRLAPPRRPRSGSVYLLSEGPAEPGSPSRISMRNAHKKNALRRSVALSIPHRRRLVYTFLTDMKIFPFVQQTDSACAAIFLQYIDTP